LVNRNKNIFLYINYNKYIKSSEVTLGQCDPNFNFARKYLASNLKIGGYGL